MTSTDLPISSLREGQLLLKGVAQAIESQAVDILIRDTVIESIMPSSHAINWICLPPLADLHVHANRAYTIAPKRPDSFEDAVHMTMELFENFSKDQYAQQALKLFQTAYVHGTTQMRSHADLDETTKLRAIQGTLEARDQLRDKMDVQIVAFATANLDPVQAASRRLLKEAIDQGADLLGATPVLYPEPGKSLKALFELAAELDTEVDVHLDEHLDIKNSWSNYLADLTLEFEFQGRVTLSHGCAISVLESSVRKNLIEKLARAEVSVIALPLTNLYLQDRLIHAPKNRGLAPVRALQEVGVKVLFGTDNVCDAFYPFGNADLLDTAYAGMLATQLDTAEHLLPLICNSRNRIKTGDPAELLLIKGNHFDKILSHRPKERILIRKGKYYLLNDDL